MNKIRMVYVLVIASIIVLTILTIFNYPKQYECYRNECIEYNIDGCEHLGTESTGFLSSEDFYLCEGVKVAKRCDKVEEVKQEYIEPNILDIISLKCSSLTGSEKRGGK